MNTNEIIEEMKINPLDYVTIPLKEYRKLIRKVERAKAELAAKEEIAKITEKAEDYRRWWKEEEKKAEELELKLAEYKKVEE